MKNIMKNRLLGNIISLIILQGSNYIFPLITFPYLVRTIGTSNYGILLFCLAIMQFLTIIVDYGFNISGTRDISINKHNKEMVNDIFNVILTVKILLTFIVGVIYFMVIESFSFFHEHKAAFLLSILILIGNCFFPIWLYQGLERMKFITYINIIAKALVTIFIFIFINNSQDLTIAVFFQSLYFLIPAVFSYFIVKMKFKITFNFIIDIRKITHELVRGKNIFMTNLWINIYTQGPLIILGFFASKHAVGNYGIGQKIMISVYGLSQPVIQAVYPYICELHERNKQKFQLFKKKLLLLSYLGAGIISIFLMIFSSQVLEIVTGSIHPRVLLLIKLFSIVLFLSILNTFMTNIMYAMNLQEVLNKIYFVAAFAFALSALPLTFFFKEVGMALSVIIVEGIVFILNILYSSTKRKAEYSVEQVHKAI